MKSMPYFRLAGYAVATIALLLSLQRAPVNTFTVPLSPSDTAPDGTPKPTRCPFGHDTLVAIPVQYSGLVEGFTSDDLKRIEALEIWDGGPGCIPLGSDTKLVCKTCRFAYDDSFYSHTWSRNISLEKRKGAPYFALSEVIANTPLPVGKDELKRVRYFKEISSNAVLSESCGYWTKQSFEDTISRFQDYLASSGVTPATQRPSSHYQRKYFYACARYDFHFLKIEIMEENKQVYVKCELMDTVTGYNDSLMQRALAE